MKREQILQEIARLDEEINRIIASAQLPQIEYRPFPFGTWVLAAMCFAWWKFGGRIPHAFILHFETARYGLYMGVVFSLIALLSTISWLIRGRASGRSDEYLAASRDARELQERRRELQAELRSLPPDR